MVVRRELAPGSPVTVRPAGETLLCAVHLSDLHVCDTQSPGRLELLDRFGDPDHPAHERVGHVGSYRPQEILTTQVAAAMVTAVNGLSGGPATGAPVEAAISTGDNVDNAQLNEIRWYLGVLDGGRVTPDSGDPERFEGVAGSGDPAYWQPETGGCRPTTRFGLPTVPGLLTACRRPFDSPGLTVPWFTSHGNHDRLVQGTLALPDELAGFTTGAAKPVAFPEDWDDGARVAFAVAAGSPGGLSLDALRRLRFAQVTPDADRRIVSRAEFIAAHGDGHGFTGWNRETGLAYYRHDLQRVTLLVLDTVNHHGYWQGSVDDAQFDWLRGELTSADAERRYCVIASHHPAHCLTNALSDGSDRRVLEAELLAELTSHPSAVLWLSGHTHRHAVRAHAGPHPLWEATTASLIDAPQQARTVEVTRRPGGLLAVDLRAVDHAGEAPWGGGTADVTALAGLSRHVAALDWQTDAAPPPPGEVDVTLLLPDPFA
ncbi:TIGR03767 family metallophosphoesterase [Tsukamurella soli]|uniref:TIGR03767 family metallophosphoesterase n=1 Tax=Tsukamurella soli TaxID=644556 RepID=A0ABP8JYS9_9ACTN